MTRRRLVTAPITLLAASLAWPLVSHASSPGLTERHRQVVAKAFGQWAAGGKTFFQDVLSPDVTWTVKGSGPAAGTYRGRDEFLARAVTPFVARLASPIRPTVNHVWADGEHVIVQWDGVATAADGAPYRNSYVWIFRMRDGRAIEVTAFLDLAPYDDINRRIPLPSQKGDHAMDKSHSYGGLWVTGDGHVRQALLPNGRYDEARGSRQSAYRGRYEVTGDRIAYWDDTGFTADGVFVDANTLHHGGMVFRRQ